MGVLSKTYNTASGELRFDFIYSTLISGVTLDDLDIVNIGELNYGYDNENNIDLSIYPSNIDIIVDDLTGDNYTKFRSLIEGYSLSFPYNHDLVFRLEISLNQQIIFKGYLDELESDKDKWELTLKFIDGINKYKDTNIANPYVLKKLRERGIIKGANYGSGVIPSVAYGFGQLNYVNVSGHPEKTGYYVNDLYTGDKDTLVSSVISELFKLLNDAITVDFDIQYLFRDILTGSQAVSIGSIYVRRILSNLLGRYVVINKIPNYSQRITYVEGNPEYTREQYFEIVYDDANYVVFKHTFSGYDGSYKWEKGTDDKTIGDLLKSLAYNFFSYFGFKNNERVFFRHRRYLSSPIQLTEILSMEKMLSTDKVQGVSVKDYYTENFASKGSSYGGSEFKTITYKIPLNTFRGDNNFEYRMTYKQSGAEKRVIYMKDLQIGVEDIPQETLSHAEWEAHKNYRDKYEFRLNGINYDFDSSYSVDYLNYQGKFRPVELSKDLLGNKSTMKAIQIN